MSLKLPYIQVTAETWTYARSLAGMLEISMGQAFMILCDLWSWGLSLGPKDQPPTGEFVGSYALGALAGAVAWTGDKLALKEALVQLDLIVITDEGLRVRGMDRYHDAWRAASGRAVKAKAAAAIRWAREHPDAPAMLGPTKPDAPAMLGPMPQDAYTQTQTHTQIEKKHPPRAKPEVSTAPPGQFRDRIEAEFQKQRGAAYDLTSADETAVGALLGKGPEEEVHRRWRIGLGRTAYPRVNTLVELVRHWNACASETTGPPSRPKDITRGTVTAESQAGLHMEGDPF